MKNFRAGIKNAIRDIPFVGDRILRVLRGSSGEVDFPGSEAYWEKRYKAGGNSGAGSHNELARFKTEVLNALVAEHGIGSVIEYGCGDGNQLKLANYPRYLGFDVSAEAVRLCQHAFAGDASKNFKLLGEFSGETAELTMSLDVIYHLIEENVFEDYMRRLFTSSSGLVAIYSSNKDENPSDRSPHVKHRKFSRWIEQNVPDWRLLEHIPNKYPLSEDQKSGSFADFYIYCRSEPSAGR